MKYELPSTELIVIEENNYLKFGEYLNDMQCDDTVNKLSLDDLEYVKKLQQENQQLREKIRTYEDPNDLTLMFMYCDEKAKDKIKELKKQLTTYQILHRDCNIDNLKNISKIEEKETQQKEFIEYLENEIYSFELRGTSPEYNFENVLKRILLKYKEIIGGKE